MRMAPRSTSWDWFSRLTDAVPGSPETPSISFRTHFWGATNVHPLLSDPPRTTDYAHQRGYFTGFTMYRVQVAWGRWRLTYGWELAEQYEGNNGGVRLYLEANQETLLPTTSYPVNVRLNRSAVSRLAVDYTGQTDWGEWQIAYSVGLQGAFLRRAQQGILNGAKSGDQFTGALLLFTTRDVPPDQREGYHWGLDASVVVHAKTGWAFGVAVESLLGYSRIGQVQRIEANVAVNQFEPDSEGFLRGAPFLEGTTRPVPLSRSTEPYYHLGFVAPIDGKLRSAFLVERLDRWRWGVGLTEAQHWWAIAWLKPPALQLGYRWSHGWLALGIDHNNPQKAQFLMVEVGFGFPL